MKDKDGRDRTPNPVELHIEELVLQGFAPGDRYRIADSLGHALERLFLNRGIPPGLAEDGEVEAINAGSLGVVPHAKPEAIGDQVAQAVYEGLTRGGRE